MINEIMCMVEPTQIMYSWTAAIPLITAGISGLAGLFGQKKGPAVSTSDQTQHQTSSGQQTSYNRNILSELQGNLANTAGYAAMKKYAQGPGDVSGIIGTGLQSVNQGADARSKILNNVLSSRGLAYSPTAVNAVQQNDSARVSDGTGVIAQAPLIQRQINEENLADLMKTFGMLPTDSISDTTSAQTSDGTSNTKSTGTPSQSPIGGLLSGLGSGLFAPSSPGGGSNLSAILKALGMGGGN